MRENRQTSIRVAPFLCSGQAMRTGSDRCDESSPESKTLFHANKSDGSRWQRIPRKASCHCRMSLCRWRPREERLPFAQIRLSGLTSRVNVLHERGIRKEIWSRFSLVNPDVRTGCRSMKAGALVFDHDIGYFTNPRLRLSPIILISEAESIPVASVEDATPSRPI